MKNVIITFTLTLLICSCGKKSSGSKNSADSNPLTNFALTAEEKEFSEMLLKKGSMSQQELIKEISQLSNLSQNTLKKLDKVIDVQCSQASGLCDFSPKE